MKRVIWDVIDPEKIKAGDVIKWEEDCHHCGGIRSSIIATVIRHDYDLNELNVFGVSYGGNQTWDILTDVRYLVRR